MSQVTWSLNLRARCCVCLDVVTCFFRILQILGSNATGLIEGFRRLSSVKMFGVMPCLDRESFFQNV